MGCCTSRLFLNAAEQVLINAQRTLKLHKLNYKTTIRILKPFKEKEFIEDQKLSDILACLKLTDTETAKKFYCKLKGTKPAVRYRQLATTFSLCSQWEDSQKAEVLFEAYSNEGGLLELQNAAEMIDDIYSIVVDNLPSLVDSRLVTDYLANISEFKADAKQAVLSSLFRRNNLPTTWLSLTTFQEQFGLCKVKFLSTPDARMSFKRIATVREVKLKSDLLDNSFDEYTPISIIGESPL